MGNVKSFCCKDNLSEFDEHEDRTRILADNCEEFHSNNSIISGQSQQDNISYGSINSDGNGSKSMEQSVLDKIYQRMASNVIDVAPGDSMIIQQAEFIERQKAYQAKLSQLKTALPLKLANHHHHQQFHNHHLQNRHQLPKHVGSSFDTRMPTSSPSSASTNSTSLATLHNTCPNFSTTSAGSGNHLSPNTITMTNNTTTINRIQDKRRVEYEPISTDEVQLIKEVSLKSVEAIKNLKIDTDEEVVIVFKP